MGFNSGFKGLRAGWRKLSTVEVCDMYSSLILLGQLPYGRWNGLGTRRTWQGVLWGSLCRSGYKFEDKTSTNLKGREWDIV